MWLHCLCPLFFNSCLLAMCVYHMFNSQNTVDSHCRWLLLHSLIYVIFMWYVTPPCHMWPFICVHMYNMYYPVHIYINTFSSLLQWCHLSHNVESNCIYIITSGELQLIPECSFPHLFFAPFIYLYWNCCLSTNIFAFS